MSFRGVICCHILAVIVLLLEFDQGFSQCVPIEEGRPFSMTCPGGACRNHLLYEWTMVRTGASERLISHCDTTLGCTGNNNFFTINIAKNGTGHQSTLTVHKVSRTAPFNSEGKWTCQYCGTDVSTCSLQIFVKPVNPKCEATELTDGTGQLTQVQISCSLDDVYPAAVCSFKIVQQDGPSASSLSSGSCKRDVSISEFYAGQNVIDAKIGSSRQPNLEQIKPITVSPSIRLWLPTTSVDCQNTKYSDGYYKGENVSCLCKLDDPGKPRGQSAWHRDGAALPTTEFSSSHHNKPAGIITCVGTSEIGQETPGTTFSPKFAFLLYGAINLTTVYEERPIDGSNVWVFAICEIPRTGVNPSPRIVILLDDVATSTSDTQYYTDENYGNTVRFRPLVGGLFTLKCRVENTIFPELVEERASDVTIHSPVQFKEASTIKEYYKFEIKPDTPVIIRVDITAYPPATNFTLYIGYPGENTTADNYDVQYKERTPSTGTVELTMTINNASDLALYTLVIDNGIGDGLNYTFTIEEDTGDDMAVVYIVVGVVCGVILIIAIVLLVLWRIRRSKEDSEGLQGSGQDGKEIGDTANPDDEENIYNEPEGDEKETEEDDYENYVNKDEIPPSEIAPPPPKTKGELYKIKKLKKGKKSQTPEVNKTTTTGTAESTSEAKTPDYVNTPSGADNNIEIESMASNVPPHTFKTDRMYVNVPEAGDATEDCLYSSITDQMMY